MSPKLPGYFITVAIFIMAASMGVKKSPLFLESLGHSEIFEWGCAILSSICISVGLVLALYGLATQAAKRRLFLGVHLCAITVLCVMMGLQFAGYVVFTKIYYQLDQLPGVLPKLVENARTADTENKRQKMAQNAYKIYGVTIAYRRDNGDLAYYEPTAQDIVFQQNFVETCTKNHRLNEEIIGGKIKQLPFVIAVEMGAFFLTFVVGSLWLAFQKTKGEPNLQP